MGPEAITIEQMYAHLLGWLGLGRARLLSIPYSIAIINGRIAGFLGDMTLTKESIQMLQRGNTAKLAPFVDRFCFVPSDFERALKKSPAQHTDRWHAGLYCLRPLLRFAIAFVWIFTGIVPGFVFPLEQRYAMLEQAGLTGLMKPVIGY